MRFVPVLVILVAAIAYYGSYWHFWFNPHDEGGTACLIAQRLMHGERPWVDVEPGYNIGWFYPIVGLFHFTGVNFLAVRAWFFLLATITALLGCGIVSRVTGSRWWGMVTGLLLVVFPGSQFKDYIPLAEAANTACLIHLLYIDPKMRRRWLGWFVLGGVVLGLTFLVRVELGYFFTAIWALLLLVSLFDRRASIGGRFAGLILGALAVVFGVVIAQTPAYVPLRAHGLEKEYWAEYLDWLEFLRASLHTRVAQEKPALAAGLGAPQTAASATPTADGSDAASNPTAATVKNAANGERSVLPRKPLSSISNKGWRERILTFLTYAPIVGFGVFFIIGVIGFLMSVFRRDFALTAVPLEWLLLIGGSLTTFPQFFFFRPDRPHLSEFMPGYIIAMMASAWLLWPRGSKHPVVRRLFAGLVSLFLIGQFLIFAVFAMQHPSSGTIAARFGRKARFQGENGVRVHTSKKEAAILQGVYDIVMKSSGPDDYLICYPYMPGYNVMTNRRTYLHNVYVDNATRGSHWSENTIRDLEEKHPAVVIIDDREINGTPASRFTHWGAPVYAFLKKHYKMAGKFETVEVFTLPHPSATPEAPAAPAPAPTPIPPATPAPAASTPTAPAPATPAPVVPPNPPPTESPATTPAPSTPPVPAPTTPSAPPTATPAPSTTPPGLPEAPPAGESPR
ncbi:hypothetical protein EV701_111101 [Chthoniobacter flavus]|uniref:hypothetical protein n=1 Tax=Chthoniobacter flavus TaxID=191863 RepID=UPI00104F53D0|nr:hypothetical protein [Chthoniobacter flavus]TCO90175.1 hypothetical protein EV701_111101 [Chthoniobacter flavus]